MFARAKKLSLPALTVAAFVGATSMAVVQELGTITLYGCAVDVRPGGQVEATVKGTTSYSSTNNVVNAEVQIWIPDNVAMQTGDFNGGNPKNLADDAVNDVALQYDVANDTMTMSYTSGGTTTTWSLPTTGIFDQFDDTIQITKEQLPNITETKRRVRLVVETFGITTGLVVRDA